MTDLKAPFPWFGGKRKVAQEVWRRFGGVRNYVEPFFGSGAVLLGRPQPFVGTETINDLDGFVANAWRSIKLSPKETAEWADNPVNENDLHARHSWLVNRRDDLRPLLDGNPDYHDPKIAGYWLWGICCWIGYGFCSSSGPWHVDQGGKLTKDGTLKGRGVSRGIVHLGGGRGVNRKDVDLQSWFSALSDRLRRVRVCSGDWSRVCRPAPTYCLGLTGVFFDPPYDKFENLYRENSQSVSHDVREWAIEAGKRPDIRIALCGYDGEHNMPDDWSIYQWSAHGGYTNSKDNVNRHKERIYFSPACLSGEQDGLFDRKVRFGIDPQVAKEEK